VGLSTTLGIVYLTLLQVVGFCMASYLVRDFSKNKLVMSGLSDTLCPVCKHFESVKDMFWDHHFARSG
jgi:hypothetical protein